MTAKMRNVGEACTAANRFHVAAPIADEFARRLAERMAALKVGRGTESRHRRRAADRRAPAREGRRARRRRPPARRPRAHRRRGRSPAPATSTSPPCCTVSPPTPACSPRRSSGPSPRSPPSTPRSEALAAANRTEYGLVAYLYTRDLARAFRVAEGIETGMIGLNQGIVSNAAAPFGGVKESGFGREGGFEGIGEYLETKYVALSLESARLAARLQLREARQRSSAPSAVTGTFQWSKTILPLLCAPFVIATGIRRARRRDVEDSAACHVLDRDRRPSLDSARRQLRQRAVRVERRVQQLAQVRQRAQRREAAARRRRLQPLARAAPAPPRNPRSGRRRTGCPLM